jgi:hypothetical protein
MVRYVLFCIFVPKRENVHKNSYDYVKNQMENDLQSPVIKRRLRLNFFPSNLSLGRIDAVRNVIIGMFLSKKIPCKPVLLSKCRKCQVPSESIKLESVFV